MEDKTDSTSVYKAIQTNLVIDGLCRIEGKKGVIWGCQISAQGDSMDHAATKIIENAINSIN